MVNAQSAMPVSLLVIEFLRPVNHKGSSEDEQIPLQVSTQAQWLSTETVEIVPPFYCLYTLCTITDGYVALDTAAMC